MDKSTGSNIEGALRDPLLVDYSIEKLRKLNKRLKQSEYKCFSKVSKVKVSVQGGFMTSFLTEILPMFLLHRGIDAEIREAPYGTFQTEILDSNSQFWAFSPDIALILPTFRDLEEIPNFNTNDLAIERIINSELNIWRSIWNKLKCQVVQLSFGPPPTRILGEADGLYPGGRTHHIREINRTLAREAPSHVTFVDTEHLISQLRSNWHDERLYYLAKQPFSMEALPLLANTLAASTAGALGLSRKALILDLDNTLWGGVIGDDGLEGIVLGPETAEGEAFVAFQRYIKSLSERGVIICVCSKNDDANARLPFEKHKAMVLTLESIADFRANFIDKATNIKAIANSLNLNLDAFVFVDDSPVECELVKQLLPQVWTIQFTGDVFGFPNIIDRIIPFPTGRITKEDLRRANSYKLLNQVQTRLKNHSDIDSFLHNLKPVAILETVRDDTVVRISQLISKTNQFKLNPSKFTPPELRERAENVLAIRLKDRLQDYGIIAVAIMQSDKEHGHLEIINWVMSCRVFSRRLEFLTFELLRIRAQKAQLNRLCLRYIESDRNRIVSDFLFKLGFNTNKSKNQFSIALSDENTLYPPHFITCENGYTNMPDG